MLAIPARVIATIFAITCFLCTLVFGLYNGNDWFWIVINAMIVGAIAWVVGTIVGMLILRTVNEHIENYRSDNPIPNENNDSETGPAATAAG